MAEPEPGAGDVVLELDGKEYLLKPSWQACQAISRLAGGGAAAVQRCQALDFDTIVAIIGHGIGANPQQMQKMVPELVYKTGTMKLAAKCIDFINVVNNGGMPPGDEEEEQDTVRDPTVPGSQSGNITES